MSIIYKTLFEVKVMHEYYLTRQDGTVVFEETDPQKRLEFLQKEFADARVSISSDIQFEFPESIKSKYAGLFLKLLPSYSGCRVAVRVSPTRLADQSTVYTPVAPLPEDLPIFIIISRKNNSIDSYTSGRINRSVPSIYVFSNNNLISPRTFPFLTNNIPAEDSSVEYEQGELALSTTNTIREFYRQGGTDQWSDVKGSGFSNESDRLLLPERFEYRFGNSLSLTQASVTLKDANNTEVANFSLSNSSGIASKCVFDFSGKVKGISQNLSLLPASLIYTLEVSGNNGYKGKHSVMFSNELTASNPWAVLDIRSTVANTDFNFFAPDGFLKKRRDPFGNFTAAPCFEIPVRSRLAYWRYQNNRGKEMDISPELIDYVNKEENKLVTKKPRSLAKNWFFLRRDLPPGTMYVPNPVSFDLKLENDRRFFYDIRVPQSKLFPLI
jgi:hypothetical protein